MANPVQQHIYIIEGESKVHEVTEILERSGMKVSCFARISECLDQLRSGPCQLLIIDLTMPEMNGINLMKEVKRLFPLLPVLVVSDQGDVPMAVKAIKAGAADFIQRPLDKENFVKATRSIVGENEALAETDLGNILTRKERRVLALVMEGKSNREMAELLHRSVKTVEVHRSNIMRKLRAKNVLDLVKRVAALGFMTLQADQRADETV